MKSATNHKRKGIAIVWVSLIAIVMLGFAGLLVDAARVYVTSHQIHNAADSAALAGARYVAWDPNSTTKIVARNKALEYAQKNNADKLAVNLNLNTANADDGDIIIGRYSMQNRTFTPTLNTPNAMKVVGRKDGISNPRLPLIFGRMFGVNDASVQNYAIAMIYNASGAAIIALSEDDIGIYLHGTPIIDIDNGGTIFSHSVDIAGDFRGTPTTEVAEINLVGDYTVSGTNYDPDNMTYDGLPATLNTGAEPIGDPYNNPNAVPPVFLPEPDYSGLPDLGTIDEAGTVDSPKVYSPGYYSGGIEKPDSGYIVLQPGIYHLGGTGNKGGINIQNDQCTITATGVMFHIVGGSVNINGGDLTQTPLSNGSDYDGISFFQARGYEETAEINGNGKINVTGVLYFPDNKLWIAGNGDTIGTQLIADTIEIAGTGEINIPWNGTPQISNKSILVE